MLEWASQFLTEHPFIRVLDILIVWYLMYNLLMYARGTQMMNLLKGVGIFIGLKFFASIIGLQTIDWILGQVMAWGVVAAIILFQPELRRALEILGRDLFSNRRTYQNPSTKLIEDLEYALKYMSKRKIGALIVIESQDELTEIIETGIVIDSKVTSQLLINIFIPNTPLHDGAVVIRNYRIAAASCYLPLSDDSTISKELGTRHRAGIGLGEVSDALTLIVSEETGSISIVKNEIMHRAVHFDQLVPLLESYLLADSKAGNEPKNDLWSQIRGLFKGTGFVRGDHHE